MQDIGSHRQVTGKAQTTCDSDEFESVHTLHCTLHNIEMHSITVKRTIQMIYLHCKVRYNDMNRDMH